MCSGQVFPGCGGQAYSGCGSLAALSGPRYQSLRAQRGIQTQVSRGLGLASPALTPWSSPIAPQGFCSLRQPVAHSFPQRRAQRLSRAKVPVAVGLGSAGGPAARLGHEAGTGPLSTASAGRR